MAIKKYIYKMYEKILKKLQALSEIYDFLDRNLKEVVIVLE